MLVSVQINRAVRTILPKAIVQPFVSSCYRRFSFHLQHSKWGHHYAKTVRRAYPTCAWTQACLADVQCKLSGLGSHIKVPTGVNQADEASTDLRTL